MFSSMGMPLAALTITNDRLLLECSYRALATLIEPLEAMLAYGDDLPPSGPVIIMRAQGVDS